MDLFGLQLVSRPASVSLLILLFFGLHFDQRPPSGFESHKNPTSCPLAFSWSDSKSMGCSTDVSEVYKSVFVSGSTSVPLSRDSLHRSKVVLSTQHTPVAVLWLACSSWIQNLIPLRKLTTTGFRCNCIWNETLQTFRLDNDLRTTKRRLENLSFHW